MDKIKSQLPSRTILPSPERPLVESTPVKGPDLPADQLSTPRTRIQSGRGVEELIGSLKDSASTVQELSAAHAGLDPSRVAKLLQGDDE